MTDLQSREWRVIAEQRRPGPMQMALEEVAARTAAGGGPRTVRVYRWEPSTLSLGYRQDPDSVDWAYCNREEITVTRRQTGGGGIYHDAEGDISYAIVAPADELPGDLMDCYDLLCTPILDALERMGISATFAEAEQSSIYQPSCYLRGIHPAHDVLAGGKKISGNAQYRQRDAVVQHGSLSYAVAPERHLGVFATDEVDEATFRERVTSIRDRAGIAREGAVATLESTLREWCQATEREWTDPELAQAREIADQKYESESWNCERTDPLSG